MQIKLKTSETNEIKLSIQKILVHLKETSEIETNDKFHLEDLLNQMVLQNVPIGNNLNNVIDNYLATYQNRNVGLQYFKLKGELIKALSKCLEEINS